MRIGIDLGGSKTEAVALDDDGEVVFRRREPTPGGDYAATLSTVAGLVAGAERAVGVADSVGIGTPGTTSLVDGSMKNCNSTWLNGRPLQRDLEQALGRPVRIANDANCFALSEAVDGAAAGRNIVFGVILGTGVGGGVSVGGRLLQGASSIGSEWGHNLLPGIGVVFENQERPCYCGNSNCIETYLSGPGLTQSYMHGGGEEVAAREVAARAQRGEPVARETLALYQRQLAYALSQVINILDADVVVVGGGLSNIASLYTSVPELWRAWVFSDTVNTELVPARYGDSSGVRGAAWLWRD